MIPNGSCEQIAEWYLQEAERAWQQKRVEDALTAYLAAVRSDRRCHRAHRALAMIFDMVNKPDLCIFHMECAVEAAPDNAQYRFQLGTFLYLQKKFESAGTHLNEALRIAPEHHQARNHLGVVMTGIGLPAKAEPLLRCCVEQQPENFKFQTNLASSLINQGKLQEGIFHFRKALELNPSYPLAQSNYLFALNYLPDVDAETLYAESCKHATCMQTNPPSVLSSAQSISRRREPRRIGYVSADFRTHSVAYFIAPVLASHSDNFEIFVYSNVAVADDMTRQIRTTRSRWRDIYGRSDEDVIQMIREDKIDILVDLSGHTAENRLPLFMHKNAPLQITWLGYPATTGLPTFDYRLTDLQADPRQQQRFYSETLYRLPEGFLCYQPPAQAPQVAHSPHLQNGHITFGSFNNLPKINDTVIHAWTRLLHAIPDSRLFLKNKFFRDTQVRTHFTDLFIARGIKSDRVELCGFTPGTQEHLNLYGKIDIALDTFPYNGTTTTCEALWMGVPVVSLAGNRHASRVGLSILSRLGLSSSLVATDINGYYEVAFSLAASPSQLVSYRQSLRETMRKSALCDPGTFTGFLEDAYRDMWEKMRSSTTAIT